MEITEESHFKVQTLPTDSYIGVIICETAMLKKLQYCWSPCLYRLNWIIALASLPLFSVEQLKHGQRATARLSLDLRPHDHSITSHHITSGLCSSSKRSTNCVSLCILFTLVWFCNQSQTWVRWLWNLSQTSSLLQIFGKCRFFRPSYLQHSFCLPALRSWMTAIT